VAPFSTPLHRAGTYLPSLTAEAQPHVGQGGTAAPAAAATASAAAGGHPYASKAKPCRRGMQGEARRTGPPERPPVCLLACLMNRRFHSTLCSACATSPPALTLSSHSHLPPSWPGGPPAASAASESPCGRPEGPPPSHCPPSCVAQSGSPTSTLLRPCMLPPALLLGALLWGCCWGCCGGCGLGGGAAGRGGGDGRAGARAAGGEGEDAG
jgi:hypothetical protein